MSARSGRLLIVCVVVLTLCGRVRGQDFKAPENGVVSAQQFTAYMAAQADLIKAAPALAQAVNDAPTPEALTAAKVAVDKSMTDCATAHKLSRDEYDWIGNQTLDAYEGILGVDLLNQKAKDLDAQAAENDVKYAAAKQKLATYSAAQQEGRRVMTDGEKAATTQAAAADKDASTLQLREDGDALAAANVAVKTHTDAQKAAQIAMKSPPDGLDAVAKASYIVQQNDEVEKERSAVDDAGRMATDAQNNIDIDNQHIADDTAHLAHPDMPANAKEKAEIDKINADAVADAQKEMDDATKFAAGVGDKKAKFAADAVTLVKDIPPANLELIRAHRDDYARMLDALGIAATPATLDVPDVAPAAAAPAAPDTIPPQQ